MDRRCRPRPDNQNSRKESLIIETLTPEGKPTMTAAHMLTGPLAMPADTIAAVVLLAVLAGAFHLSRHPKP